MLVRSQFEREMTDELVSSTTLGFKSRDGWKRAFHVKKTDKMRIEKSTFVHPSVVAETEEGGALNRLVVRHGYNVFCVPKTYTGEIKISHEFMRDLRMEEVKRDAFGLGKAFARNRYNLATDILINGFSSVTSPDGVSLFSDDHELAVNKTYDGEGNSNLVTGALTTDNFDAAIVKLMTMVDDNGDVINDDFDEVNLICVPSNRRQALQIAGSSHEPENMNNAINVYSGQYGDFKVNVICMPLLQGRAPSAWRASQWYVQVPGEHGLEFYERESIDTWTAPDTNSLSLLYQGLDSFGFMITDWRNMVGSKGQ
jgi:hypothetical protein